MVLIIQVNETGRSANMIQHKILAFRRQIFIEPLLYIYLYICFFFSYDMIYSGTGTMLHLAELV